MKKFILAMLLGLAFGLTGCASTDDGGDGDEGSYSEDEMDDEIMSSDDGGDSDIFADDDEESESEEAETSFATDEDGEVATPEPEQIEEEEAAPEPMEESIAAPEPEPEPEPAPVAEASSKDRAAMRRLKKDCNMRSAANGKKSSIIKVMKSGRKMWTEPHNNRYFKIYRKSGTAFISKSCF